MNRQLKFPVKLKFFQINLNLNNFQLTMCNNIHFHVGSQSTVFSVQRCFCLNSVSRHVISCIKWSFRLNTKPQLIPSNLYPHLNVGSGSAHAWVFSNTAGKFEFSLSIWWLVLTLCEGQTDRQTDRQRFFAFIEEYWNK